MNISNLKMGGCLAAGSGLIMLEQTLGIDQINLAIREMDQVTKQNAALVEEAAAAAAD
jgi:hypothetical protein